MERTILFIALVLVALTTRSQYKLLSPDKQIEIRVDVSQRTSYSVFYKGEEIIQRSSINLVVSNDDSLLNNPRLKRQRRRSANDTIISPVPEKRVQIPDVYNELILQFNKPIDLVFRAYNDGIAYRFATRYKDSISIQNEIAEFNFVQNHTAYYTQVVKRPDLDIFHTSFEENYSIRQLDSIGSADISFTPTLVDAQKAKLVITESDLEDYPGMFLKGNNNTSLSGIFAPYPMEEKVIEGEFPQAVVTRRAPYIARTRGTRNYPWRVIAIAGNDRELPLNDIVYRLASPSRVADYSFIKPGISTEEWIIGINLFNIPFRSGINTATYKYYIDFAKRFGLERIMLDAGWSDYKDLFKVNPNLDMNEIAAYARSNGIALSMWTLAMTLDRQLDSALKQFNNWGVDFIMTDFIDRDDQKSVQFHQRIAEACAKHKIMVMYHGSFKPAGFNRTYPNAVTREGVLGSEYNAWSNKPTPDHNLLLPFIRMIAGPMDYEPGLLDNGTKETFRPIWNKVMSMGTRCHQLAMFVVYESPIQMFSGNPSQGNLEPPFMELLGSIPTTWDDTKILEAQLGEYIVTARKKQQQWFVAGMSNWQGKEINLDLSFLGEGNYSAVICKDGVNADRHASDYLIENSSLTSKDRLKIIMAPGGGFLIRFQRQ